jgi:hypothetical protein
VPAAGSGVHLGAQAHELLGGVLQIAGHPPLVAAVRGPPPDPGTAAPHGQPGPDGEHRHLVGRLLDPEEAPAQPALGEHPLQGLGRPSRPTARRRPGVRARSPSQAPHCPETALRRSSIHSVSRRPCRPAPSAWPRGAGRSTARAHPPAATPPPGRTPRCRARARCWRRVRSPWSLRRTQARRGGQAGRPLLCRRLWLPRHTSRRPGAARRSIRRGPVRADPLRAPHPPRRGDGRIGASCDGPSPPSARIIRIARPRRARRPYRGPGVVCQCAGWRLGGWSGRH